MSAKDKMTGLWKGLVRVKASRARLLEISCLAITLVAAFLVRTLPGQWGFHLSAYDPYFQYRSTEYVVDHGFLAYFDWKDNVGWYPEGRHIGAGSFPALPFTAAFIYMVLRSLGVPIYLWDLCIIFPVVIGTLTCLALYFLAKEIGGSGSGLLAALFLSLYGAHIRRTNLGFFDDETVGILSLVLLSLFFIRSVESEREPRGRLFYALASGLTFGYLLTEWGASRFLLYLIPFFMFVLVLLKKYDSFMLTSYSLTMGIGALFAAALPKLGLKSFLNIDWFVVLSVFVFLYFYGIRERFRGLMGKNVFTLLLILLVGAIGLAVAMGYIRIPGGKYLSVLIPATKQLNPLVESVAEHRTSAWGTYYYDLGVLALFVPVGLYFAAKRGDVKDVFLISIGLSSLYFAGSMIRLFLIAAPFVSVLAAIGISNIVRPFSEILTRRGVSPKGLRPRVGARFGFVVPAFLAILILLSPPLGISLPDLARTSEIRWSVYRVNSPTTIASSGTPIRGYVGDWLEALDWIKYNTPEDAVVAAWWDYGYWITVMGERRTLVDNGTINGTKIGEVGRMFFSEETESISILDRYDASYVVLFITYDESGISRPELLGDNGKWVWMVKIGGLDESQFYDYYTGWTEEGRNTTFYKLMHFGMEEYLGMNHTITLEHFELRYISPSNGYVFVYEVNYGG